VTSWALVNRLVGWGFLLAYFGTGALLASTTGAAGLRLLLRTFVAAGLAIALLDLALLAARFNGAEIPLAVLDVRIAGFAGNANAFAFQMLMVLGAGLALHGTHAEPPARPPQTPLRALTILLLGDHLHRRLQHLPERLPLAFTLTALLFAASRAGWGACAVVLAVALWHRTIRVRELVIVAILSGLTALIVTGDLFRVIHGLDDWAAGGGRARGSGSILALVTHMTMMMPAAAGHDNMEHLQSMLLGLKMWMAHPLFGAGLGAFIESFSREHERELVIHSTPIWLLAETGIAGLVIFAMPFVAIMKSELGRRAKPDLASRAIILTLVGFVVMGMAHDMMYQRSLWLLLGAAMFIRPAIPRQESEFPAASLDGGGER
jgi:hypothetical protein